MHYHVASIFLMQQSYERTFCLASGAAKTGMDSNKIYDFKEYLSENVFFLTAKASHLIFHTLT